jgi:hypothetical protein
MTKPELVPFNNIDLNIPTDRRGRIRWQILSQDQGKLKNFVESEARALMMQGLNLRHSDLTSAGFGYLSRAIVLHYPGGYKKLRENLKLPTEGKSKSYWTKPEAIQILEQEARQFRDRNGTLSLNTLTAANRSDLVNAIRRYYPGGIVKLKETLAVQDDAKPRGYWTSETIKREVAAIFEREGDLSKSILSKYRRTDLIAALAKYPGGLKKLKDELGVVPSQKPSGYWSVENIQAEARNFYETTGRLSQTTLSRHKRGDLIHAIWEKYPGGIRQLQSDLELGIKTRKPPVKAEHKKEDSVTAIQANADLDNLLEENDG